LDCCDREAIPWIATIGGGDICDMTIEIIAYSSYLSAKRSGCIVLMRSKIAMADRPVLILEQGGNFYKICENIGRDIVENFIIMVNVTGL
jgi:hypothetical protein